MRPTEATWGAGGEEEGGRGKQKDEDWLHDRWCIIRGKREGKGAGGAGRDERRLGEKAYAGISRGSVEEEKST